MVRRLPAAYWSALVLLFCCLFLAGVKADTLLVDTVGGGTAGVGATGIGESFNTSGDAYISRMTVPSLVGNTGGILNCTAQLSWGVNFTAIAFSPTWIVSPTAISEWMFDSVFLPANSTAGTYLAFLTCVPVSGSPTMSLTYANAPSAYLGGAYYLAGTYTAWDRQIRLYNSSAPAPPTTITTTTIPTEFDYSPEGGIHVRLWKEAPSLWVINNSVNFPANVPMRAVSFAQQGLLILANSSGAQDCARYNRWQDEYSAVFEDYTAGEYSIYYSAGGDCGVLDAGGSGAGLTMIGVLSANQNKTVDYLFPNAAATQADLNDGSAMMAEVVKWMMIAYVVLFITVIIVTAAVAQNNWVAPIVVTVLGSMLFVLIFGKSLWGG